MSFRTEIRLSQVITDNHVSNDRKFTLLSHAIRIIRYIESSRLQSGLKRYPYCHPPDYRVSIVCLLFPHSQQFLLYFFTNKDI